MGALGGNGALAFVDVDLVAEHDKGEVVRVAGRGLDEELVAPALKRLEGFCAVDVKDEYAAIGAAVKGHAERLEPFLAGRVPELEEEEKVSAENRKEGPRMGLRKTQTCMVTWRSSMRTSRVRKSAPIVAL